MQTPEDSDAGSPHTSFLHTRPKNDITHRLNCELGLDNKQYKSEECSSYCVDLVQDLPLFIRHAESLGRLDGSFHLTGPHLQVADALRLDELTQLLRKLHRGEEETKLTHGQRETSTPDLHQNDQFAHNASFDFCLLHLFAPSCESWVSSDATLDIKLTLAVAAQVDGARRDVDVHEVVDDPALDVVQHPVDQEALTHIHDFNVGEIPKKETKTSNFLLNLLWCEWDPKPEYRS